MNAARFSALLLWLFFAGDNAAPAWHVFVTGTGASEIRAVRFDGSVLTVERTTRITAPDDSIAVQELAVAPGGATLYATAGQGTPRGRLYKIESATGRVIAMSKDLAPGVSSIEVSPDGALVYVVMNDPANALKQGSMWLINTNDMQPVASLGTCLMPLNGRLTMHGARHITACGMEDQIIDIDAVDHRIVRKFSVVEDAEGPVDTAAAKPEGEYMEGRVLAPTCSPTAAQPSPKGDRVWVTCNRNSSMLEIDAVKWALVRHIDTGHGPITLAVTPDGKQLVVVLRQGAAVQFFDAGSGKALEQVPTSAAAPQSIALSSDGRFAFVTCAGEAKRGEEPGAGAGALDVFDTKTHKRVASLALDGRPGAVAFWKMD